MERHLGYNVRSLFSGRVQKTPRSLHPPPRYQYLYTCAYMHTIHVDIFVRGSHSHKREGRASARSGTLPRGCDVAYVTCDATRPIEQRTLTRSIDASTSQRQPHLSHSPVPSFRRPPPSQPPISSLYANPQTSRASGRTQLCSPSVSLPSQLVRQTCLSLATVLLLSSRICSYDKPPLEDITIEDFETAALDRLRVLAEIESCFARNRSFDETVKVIEKFCEDKHCMELHSSSAKGKNIDDERRRDHIGHFVLRLAFCRSCVSAPSESRTWPLTCVTIRGLQGGPSEALCEG